MKRAYQVANEKSGFAARADVELAILRGWEHADGALTRDLEFRDFEEAIGFAEQLGQEAVDWLRRPDMKLAAGHLRLIVENRHHAGFTKAEIRLVNKASDVIDRRLH